MKKVLALLFAACVVWAGVAPATNVDRAKMDDGSSAAPIIPHLPDLQRAATLIDSSPNGYSMWTPMQECISYDAVNGGVQFVCRNRTTSGNLDANQTDALFTFQMTDFEAYNGSLGPARYPSSVCSDGPHLSAAVLTGGAWGIMMGEYESGDWYSSFWDAAVDVGPGNLGVHKNTGKQLANGDILFVAVTGTDEIKFSTWSPDLSTMRANGNVATGMNYGGFDVNGGVAFVSYYDASLNMYYKTTTDGITWSAETPWSITWPMPYTSNVLYWNQMAVNSAGTPIFVFDMVDGDDGTYPWSAHTYVAIGPGSTPVEVGDAGISTCWYPTVAADGGKIVVLYHSVAATSGSDSLAKFDLYYNVSNDNGATWMGPTLLIDGSITGVGLAQIAKRVNTTDGLFYYAYGVNVTTGHDPIWHCGWDPEGLDVHYWYWGNEPVGIEEGNTTRPGKTVLYATPNPVRNTSHIEYTVAASGTVELRLFGVDGRLVKVVDSGYRAAGTYTANLNASQLANGTYLLVLEQGTQTASRTIVIAR